MSINYLNLINKRVNTKAAAHRCSVAVLKNQKQPSAHVFRIGILKKLAVFRGKHLCWSLFLMKLQVCNFPVNIAKFLATAFFIKHLRWLLLKNSRFNISGGGVIDISF